MSGKTYFGKGCDWFVGRWDSSELEVEDYKNKCIPILNFCNHPLSDPFEGSCNKYNCPLLDKEYLILNGIKTNIIIKEYVFEISSSGVELRDYKHNAKVINSKEFRLQNRGYAISFEKEIGFWRLSSASVGCYEYNLLLLENDNIKDYIEIIKIKCIEKLNYVIEESNRKIKLLEAFKVKNNCIK